MKRENNTEQMILDAAEAEFLLKGYNSSKTTDIARAAGVTHAMLHYYFRTKENLFNKVFDQKVKLVVDLIYSSSIKEEIPFLDKLKLGIEAHFNFLKANPSLPLFVINEIFSKPSKLERLANTINSLAPGFINSFQKNLDQLYISGEAKKLNAFDLIVDIISLNVFTFIMFPLLSKIYITNNDSLGDILELRKQEIITTIMSRILN